MTKARAPLGIATAVEKIGKAIGWENAAAAVGLRKRAVQYWGEPDTTTLPSLQQAITLDAAYVAHGGEGMPIGDAYRVLVGIQANTLAPCRDELTQALATASTEFGEAIAHTVRIALADACQAKVAQAIVEVEQSKGALARLGSLLSRFLIVGAGSAAGNSGGAR